MINTSAKIHPQALVENDVTIGANTRIWAFAHILPHAVIGADCNICDHTLIENEVILGDRVTVKCGVYIWSGVTVENDVFIGPCVAFTNDKRPRSRQYVAEYPKTLLRQGCSIGANATLLPGIIVGRYAMIGAGAVVTRNVPDHALVLGNPARQIAWVCSCGLNLDLPGSSTNCQCGLRYELVTDAETNQILLATV